MTAWAGGFSVKSTMARSHAEEIAIAAELGLLTTRFPDGSMSRCWLITVKGLSLLFKKGK